MYGKKVEKGLSEQIDISIETEKDSLYIERIRIEKLKLRFSTKPYLGLSATVISLTCF